MDRDAAPAPNGWSIQIPRVVVEVIYSRERAGAVTEYRGVVNLCDDGSVERFLTSVDSPRVAGATEAALRVTWGDAAQRWHRMLNTWRRRPRVADAPQPAAPTDEPASAPGRHHGRTGAVSRIM
jgi:hypothetical protein